MSRLRKQRFQRSSIFSDAEDVNPMNYTSNLADAMLVLAVGIMLALIMAFKVNLGDGQGNGSANTDIPVEVEDLQSLLATTDENTMTLEDYELQEYGTLYIDKDGNFYVIEE